MSKSNKSHPKLRLPQQFYDMLQNLALEICPVRTDVITDFERNYLGLLEPQSSGKPQGSTSCGVPADVLLNPVRYQQEEMVTKDDEVNVVICRSILKSILFRTLEKRQLKEAIHAMKEKKVASGEIVIKPNTKSDTFYVVESGIFRTWLDCPPVHRIAFVALYRRLDFFNELALIFNVPNDMAIQAVSDGILWHINRRHFNRIFLGPSRAEKDIVWKLMISAPILKKLSAKKLYKLADLVFPRVYEKGKFVYLRGDCADGMFLVETGAIGYATPGPRGNFTHISSVGEGEIFGESALVSGDPRMFSSYAVKHSRVYFISIEMVEQIFGLCLKVVQARYEREHGF